jgi:hypothetical protein
MTPKKGREKKKIIKGWDMTPLTYSVIKELRKNTGWRDLND